MKLFTSEAVTEGHPDKFCDRVSDMFLDRIIEADPAARVAVECMATRGKIFIAGEVSTTAKLNETKMRRWVGAVIKDTGYHKDDLGANPSNYEIEIRLNRQSPDIALGTNDDVGGAGDQGMMTGYACLETRDFMPLPISLANRMAYLLAYHRKEKNLPWLLADGKTQVTVKYDDNGQPIGIDTIVISAQHKPGTKREDIKAGLIDLVITPALMEARDFYTTQTGVRPLTITGYKLFVNPTGKFSVGGPVGDTGLTGRKIVADTYGSAIPNGGGAFSGKDPTKVDRSAAYMARHIAKCVVHSGLAARCQIQLAYAIGVAEPVSVRVDTFGTGDTADEYIERAIRRVFHLTPGGIIKTFDLRRPIYYDTAAYGHFGNAAASLDIDARPWENPALLKHSTRLALAAAKEEQDG